MSDNTVTSVWDQMVSNQRDFYNSATAGSLAKLTPDSRIIQGGLTGYLVVMQYAKDIARKIAEYAQGINGFVKALVYAPNVVHTTCSDCDVRVGMETRQPVRDLLDTLISCARGAIPYITFPIETELSRWACTKDTAFVLGYPTAQFMDFSLALLKAATEEGLVLRLPKAGHISVARFLEQIENPERIAGLHEYLFKGPRLGSHIRPTHVLVGYFELGPNGFSIREREEIPLPQ